MKDRNWFPRRMRLDLPYLMALVIFFIALDSVLQALGAARWVRPALAVCLLLASTLGTLLGDRGVRVEPDGLHVLRWLRAPRFIPFAEIRKLELRRDRLSVHLDDDVLTFDDSYPGRHRLFSLLQAALDPEGEAAAELASVDDIARLLGLAAGGHLLTSQPDRWVRFVPALAVAAALMNAGLAWPGLAVIYAGGRWVGRDRRRQWLRIDGHGIEVRRGRSRLSIAWSEVAGLDTRPAPQERFYWSATQVAADRQYCLHTDHGPITFYRSDNGGHEAAEAIERVLEERAAGRRLPDASGVNPRSLSPSRLEDAVDVDRTLSVSAEASD